MWGNRMICSKCKEKNIYKANYCKKCGYVFSEEEKEKAYGDTIFGAFDRLENFYLTFSLNKILGASWFKAITLIAVISFGIYSYMNNNQFRILENENYEIQYNTNTNEYYIISEMNEIDVDFYIPKQLNQIIVNQIKGNEIIQKVTYSLEVEIILINDSDISYEIEADFETGTNQKITVKAFRK